MANANFTPDIGPYTTLKPFRFWCQKVMPLVYDDSLSYYELLGKVVDYLNKTMEDVDTQITDIQGLLSAYEALQGWVNAYYTSADFAAAIDDGLDRMAESGQLTALINAIITPQLPDIVDLLLPEAVMTLLPDEVSSQINGTVANQLPAVVSNQIGGTVATQLPAVVSNQIGGTVANQLPAVVSNQIEPVVEDKIVDPVEDWLDANVSGGIAVDRTLSVLGAGADAAFTGARLETLDNTLGYEHVADTGFIITTANPFAFNNGIINDLADFSDLGTHTYKIMVIPVNTGDKYCINAHKISIANITAGHFAITYAFCAKWVGDPDTDTPYYVPTTYSANDAENTIATVPEITIPTGQGYDETTGYLVVITANIEDPVYKVIDEGLRKDINDLKSDLDDESKNVLVSTTLLSDTRITADGTLETNVTGWKTTGLIDVSNGKRFKVQNMTSTNYRSGCFYDSSENAINGRFSIDENTYITIPSGVKYLRVSSGNANMNDGKIYVDEYTRITKIEKRGLANSEEILNIKSAVIDPNYTVKAESLLSDCYINSSNGAVLEANGWHCTPYIDLPFDDITDILVRTVTYGNGGCAFYDKNKQYIMGIDEYNSVQFGGSSDGALHILTVPRSVITNAKYVRLSSNTYQPTITVNDLWAKGNTIGGAFVHISKLDDKVEEFDAVISTSIFNSKVLVIGDSISADAYGNYPKWVTVLKNQLFLPDDTNNSSQHATGFVARYNNQANDFITRLEAISNPSQYDLVVVFGGINDYIQNIPMGSESGTDYTVSFKPAVNKFFDYLIQNFTQARLCVLLPLRTYQTWANSEGNYQQDYSDYIKKVAKSYCLPILNLTEDSGFCPFISTFSDMWTLQPEGYQSHDGTHPNEEYEEKYLAPMIKGFLQGLM